MSTVYGGVEGGGTKFVCVIGSPPDTILDEARFATTTPDETLGRVVDFFRRAQAFPGAVGVASFGPIDPDPASPTYGYITTTPKEHWGYVDVVGRLTRELGVPIGWDTDVNGAALGEWRWGAGRGFDPVVYITVGTGIGGGAIVNGRPLHGLLHPEMGHVPVLPAPGDDFPGMCPYHANCLEGMSSGPAIAQRIGMAPEQIPPDHPVWEWEAHYLALGILTIGHVLSPQRIIIGGGVMAHGGLIERIRRRLLELNNGYLARLSTERDIAGFLVPSQLGSRAGVVGALELARLATRATPASDFQHRGTEAQRATE